MLCCNSEIELKRREDSWELDWMIQKKSRRSMYRMDHHPAELMHGGSAGMKGNELAYWIDGNYHHHVYKFWRQ